MIWARSLSINGNMERGKPVFKIGKQLLSSNFIWSRQPADRALELSSVRSRNAAGVMRASSASSSTSMRSTSTPRTGTTVKVLAMKDKAAASSLTRSQQSFHTWESTLETNPITAGYAGEASPSRATAMIMRKDTCSSGKYLQPPSRGFQPRYTWDLPS
jgi:hypothetical protein